MNRIDGRMVRVSMFLVLALILAGPTLSMAQEQKGTASEATAASDSSSQADQTQSSAQTPAIPAGGTRDSTQPLTGTDLVDSDFPGSWPMFGKNVRMKIGGYVKADFLYDFDGTRDRYQFLMSTIPVPGSPDYGQEGYLSIFSRETRFNIDIRKIEKGKRPLQAFIEGDFWSSGNQLRLRHAYAVYGDLLVGQTWSTLSILESLPFLIDFAAGDALFGGRTTQVRYQRRMSDTWKLAVALEALDDMGIENPDTLAGEPSEALPLLAVRVDYNWSGGLLVLGSSIAQLRWDGLGVGPDARGAQWDAVFAGKYFVGKSDYATWNVSYGIGSGENVMAFAGSESNAVLTASGLETIPVLAAVVGYVHKWNDRFVSNFSYAYGWLDTPPSRDPLALKRGGIGHVNLIYNVTSIASTGIEYMYGAQRATNDAVGSASRIQAMFKVSF